MADRERSWTKGTKVRRTDDDRTGEVRRDAAPGQSVHVRYDAGGRSGWVAGRLLAEVTGR